MKEESLGVSQCRIRFWPGPHPRGQQILKERAPGDPLPEALEEKMMKLCGVRGSHRITSAFWGRGDVGGNVGGLPRPHPRRRLGCWL
jgi:hypothetical protein